MRIYRLILGSLGVAFSVFGLALVGSFFAFQRPNSVPLVPTGPVGHYFIAFAGCALLGWAGGLLGAARNPAASRTVATMTAFVLALMAVIRMLAWLIGDYAAWLGDLPRTEATAFLLVALVLVWVRPTVAETISMEQAMAQTPERETEIAPARDRAPEGGEA